MSETQKQRVALETAVRMSCLAMDCLIRAAQGLQELPPSNCAKEDNARGKIERAVQSAHMKLSIIEMVATQALP